MSMKKSRMGHWRGKPLRAKGHKAQKAAAAKLRRTKRAKK